MTATKRRSKKRLSKRPKTPAQAPRRANSSDSKRKEFLRFLVAGGFAAASNFGSRFLFSQFLSYEFAIVLAYLVGMTIAFVLMRGKVFKANSGQLLPQMIRFSLINLLAVAQTVFISLILARLVLPRWGLGLGPETDEAMAHAAGVLVPVITSYYGHQRVTFRHV